MLASDYESVDDCGLAYRFYQSGEPVVCQISGLGSRCRPVPLVLKSAAVPCDPIQRSVLGSAWRARTSFQLQIELIESFTGGEGTS
jgi:hypothetical protein